MMLEIKDLNLTLAGRSTPLVTVPSLRFEPGIAHVIVGRTGAGKSLIARSVAGLPNRGVSVSGSLRVDGGAWQDLGARAPLWHRDVFVLPQEPAAALDPTASVGSQIREVLRWRCRWDAPFADLASLAASVDLTAADLAKLPHECSGGMLQRALIAMALIVDAGLIICDEPTKGLDTQRCQEVGTLLSRLKEQDRGLLVITHDLALTRALADTISVIEGGRVVESGVAPKLLSRPESQALRALIDAEPPRWDARPAPAGARHLLTPIVELQSVRHTFDAAQPLLKDIDLKIHGGEIVGLCGPSGTGKTTLGDIALGLTPANAGQVRWRGRSLSALTQKERRRWRPDFAKLFQDPTATFPAWLTAGTVLTRLTPCRNDRYRDALGLERLLERLHLDPQVLSRRPDALSGGEMQRLAIARIVLVKPSFLVCDEPSSRLDMVVQRQAVDLLVEFAQELEIGLLFITHDKRVLERIADRTVELKDGRLIPVDGIPARVERAYAV